jgi:hypothetical protein
MEIWTSGFIMGSISMFSMACLVAYNIYQRRYYISYSLLLRRRKFDKKRDPDKEYTFDVFISYSQGPML